MTSRHRVGLLLLLALPGACRIEEVPRPARVDSFEVTREEISATLDAYRDALISGNAEAVAETFAPDGRLSQPDQPDYIGRDEIRSGIQRVIEGAVVTDLLMDRDDISVTADTIAHEWGTFEQTVHRAPQPPTVVRGRYAIRWRRGPQQWRIDRMLLNHFPADSANER